MKRTLAMLLLLAAFSANVWADDLESIQGKWTVKKTGDLGAFSQEVEFKKNKFTFKIILPDKTVALVAVGDIELKKQGPFNTLRFHNIKAGRTEEDMDVVDDERVSVYMISDGLFYLAGNFDRIRGDNDKPSVDAYSKSK